MLSKDINPVQSIYNVLFCYCWDLINVISLLFLQVNECVSVCIYVCTMYVLWSEDNFVGLVLSFYFYVGHQDQNQFVRLWGKYLYSLSHLAHLC